MDNNKDCLCKTAPTLIFPCSGGADVGEIADRTARKMTKEGKGKIFCLAGIGGKVSGIIASAQSAEKILVIDGCPLDCAKKTMQNGGFSDFLHLRITDLGFKKGSSPVTDETLSTVMEKVEFIICNNG